MIFFSVEMEPGPFFDDGVLSFIGLVCGSTNPALCFFSFLFSLLIWSYHLGYYLV